MSETGEFDAWPHLVLSADGVRLVVLLPDAARGYYRGPRFDGSGMVARATWGGHSWFGSWRAPPHQPEANDHAAGTAEELGMGPLTDNPSPVGYDDAAPGEGFLKIGVGLLERADTAPYSFGSAYRILRPSTWVIDSDGATLRFATEDGVRDHAFRYAKTVTARSRPPGFHVGHVLRNLGTRPIHQTHYSHHFLRVDERPVDEGYTISLPFECVFSQTAGDVLAARGKTIALTRAPSPTEGFFALVTGFGSTAADHRITIRTPTAGLRITGSEPMTRLQIFGTGRTLCPEPFVAVTIPPGGSASWSTLYDFLGPRPQSSR